MIKALYKIYEALLKIADNIGSNFTATSTDELKNKTINGDDNDISNIGADELKSTILAGWIPDTATYESSNTITVPDGSLYQKGDKLKFSQPTDGQKYMYVIGVSSNTLTVMGGDDYDLDDEDITDFYYSKQENPQGFPETFDYSSSCSVSADGDMTISNVDFKSCRFKIVSSLLYFFINVQFDTGGTASNVIRFTIPKEASELYGGGAAMFTGDDTGGFYYVENDLRIFKYDGSDFPLRTNYIRTSAYYRY